MNEEQPTQEPKPSVTGIVNRAPLSGPVHRTPEATPVMPTPIQPIQMPTPPQPSVPSPDTLSDPALPPTDEVLLTTQPAPAQPKSFEPKPFTTLPPKDPNAEPTPKKQLPPIGINFIILATLISIVAVFSNKPQLIKVLLGVLCVQLGFSLLLLLRKNFARFLVIISASLMILVSLFSIYNLYNIQHTIKQDKVKYIVAITHLQNNTLTNIERHDLTTLQEKISKNQNKVGKSPAVSYTLNVVLVAESIIIIIYLIRPKTKQFFVKQ